MKRATLTIGLVCLGLAGLSGCSSSSSVDANDAVALAVLGPSITTVDQYPGQYALGAGDSLGRAMFTNYLVVARREQKLPPAVMVTVPTSDGQ